MPGVWLINHIHARGLGVTDPWEQKRVGARRGIWERGGQAKAYLALGILDPGKGLLGVPCRP